MKSTYWLGTNDWSARQQYTRPASWQVECTFLAKFGQQRQCYGWTSDPSVLSAKAFLHVQMKLLATYLAKCRHTPNANLNRIIVYCMAITDGDDCNDSGFSG